jgi:hypothetical protein
MSIYLVIVVIAKQQTKLNRHACVMETMETS